MIPSRTPYCFQSFPTARVILRASFIPTDLSVGMLFPEPVRTLVEETIP